MPTALAKGRGPKKLESEKTGHSHGKRDEHLNVPARVVEASSLKYKPKKANKDWKDSVQRWYKAVGQSAYVELYEPSDWETVHIIAEFMDGLLDKKTANGLLAVLSAMDTVLVTEASRRRARVEIKRELPQNELASHRAKLHDVKQRLKAV